MVEREGERWKGRPIVMRMTLGEFLYAITQSKRRTAAHETRTYLLLDASAVAPYYVPQATSSDTLRERIHTLIVCAKRPKQVLPIHAELRDRRDIWRVHEARLQRMEPAS